MVWAIAASLSLTTISSIKDLSILTVLMKKFLDTVYLYGRKKTAYIAVSGCFIWRPQGGSNPCYRRERAKLESLKVQRSPP